ncbi:MAG: peptidylprolyl isomerase [Betaproteobacteria bacterium]|nr:peptidylprolyl isomerase [Betaproteobacteria bacterium]
MALCVFAGLAQAADNVRVRLETNLGPIMLELYPDKAPKSVENFLAYVDSGFYNNTLFHRVINGFVAQGGGFDTQMRQKPTRPPIANEAKNGLRNEIGSVAMARTSDPNSATSQFYINLNNNSNLDYPSFDGWGYAVFGKVVEGMDVVKKIGAVKTGPGDVPVEPVILKQAKRVAVAPAK